jgi:hypothetical protein
MSRELDLLIRQLKGKDLTLVRKDVSLLTQTLSKESAVFLKELEGQVKKNRSGTVILIGICL